MKYIKVILTTSALLFTAFTLSGCENTTVSGSVSYGVGMGYGYPMYYGGGYRHTNVTVIRPPRNRPPVSTRPRRR